MHKINCFMQDIINIHHKETKINGEFNVFKKIQKNIAYYAKWMYNY